MRPRALAVEVLAVGRFDYYWPILAGLYALDHPEALRLPAWGDEEPAK